MGEAKQRQSATARHIAEFPWCVYCGGRAETLDHVPPISLFRNRHRPKGLEVSACLRCNRGASQFELVAVALGRIRLGPVDDIDEREFGKHLRQAFEKNPGLAEEMKPMRQQLADAQSLGLAVFNTGGPIVQGALHAFGAKMGFALHSVKLGRVVNPQGVALVTKFTNHQHMVSAIPKELFALFPASDRKTLMQGTFNVGDQFEYRSVADVSARSSMHVCTFNYSYILLTYVLEHESSLLRRPGTRIYRPGFVFDPSKIEVVPS